MQSTDTRRFGQAQGFASTHWTNIRDCVGNGRSAQPAREKLCRDYWYPVYAYVRRLGHKEYDAEDMTQGFFEHILHKPWFEKANREKGRFRSFLLASLNNFVRDVLASQGTFKRGGYVQHVPLDLAEARSKYALPASPGSSAAESYDMQWAMTVVDIAWRRLEQEHATANKLPQFLELKTFLTNEGMATSYDLVAERLGTTLENVKVSVHRLRKRYGTILKEEVARTVGALVDVPAEMRHIRDALAQKMSVAA